MAAERESLVQIKIKKKFFVYSLRNNKYNMTTTTIQRRRRLNDAEIKNGKKKDMG